MFNILSFLDELNILIDFLNYIIRHHKNICDSSFLFFTENIVHSGITEDYGINYFFNSLHKNSLCFEQSPSFFFQSTNS